MIGFVLSGGANRGAIEVGALAALLDAGIAPDILVGSSVGGINCLLLAADPTRAGVDRLAQFWLRTDKDDVLPGGMVAIMARLMRRQSIFPSTALRRTLARELPANLRTFGDITGIRLFLTAANLNTGALYLYGEDPDALLLDAVMASAAHPLLFPPLESDGRQLVDGGVAANVPIGIASDHGADEVYVLDLGSGVDPAPAQTMVGRVGRSIALMMQQTFLMDLKFVLERTDTVVHHIPLTGFTDVPLSDTSHFAEMIAEGARVMARYLADPQPLREVPAMAAATAGQPAPPGAREYRPSYMRPSEVLGLPIAPRLVMTELTRHGSATAGDLSARLNLARSDVDEAVAGLVQGGQVQRAADGMLQVTLGASRPRPLAGQLLSALTDDPPTAPEWAGRASSDVPQ